MRFKSDDNKVKIAMILSAPLVLFLFFYYLNIRPINQHLEIIKEDILNKEQQIALSKKFPDKSEDLLQEIIIKNLIINKAIPKELGLIDFLKEIEIFSNINNFSNFKLYPNEVASTNGYNKQGIKLVFSTEYNKLIKFFQYLKEEEERVVVVDSLKIQGSNNLDLDIEIQINIYSSLEGAGL